MELTCFMSGLVERGATASLFFQLVAPHRHVVTLAENVNFAPDTDAELTPP